MSLLELQQRHPPKRVAFDLTQPLASRHAIKAPPLSIQATPRATAYRTRERRLVAAATSVSRRLNEIIDAFLVDHAAVAVAAIPDVHIAAPTLSPGKPRSSLCFM